MKLIETDLFRIQVPESLTCWFETYEGLKTNALFLTGNSGLQAVLEIVAGYGVDDFQIKCESSVVAAVNSLGGYADDTDEEFPDEIGVVIPQISGQIAQRHFFRYVNDIAVHFILLSEYFETDYQLARDILNSFQLNSHDFPKLPMERIEFNFPSATPLDKFGKNRFLIA